MFGPLWMRKHRSRYAQMTQEQRDFMERGMIYKYEELDRMTDTLMNRMGMTKERRSRMLKDEAARDTAAQAILMNEKLRSELFSVPPRPLAEIRWHWIQQDPAWLAAETNLTAAQKSIRADSVHKYV